MSDVSCRIHKLAGANAALDRQILSEARAAIALSLQILRDSTPETYLGGDGHDMLDVWKLRDR